jgi:hypothetical protein
MHSLATGTLMACNCAVNAQFRGVNSNINGCTLVAKSRKKQKNRWNKRKTTTTYSDKRKSISQDIDAFLEME